METANPDVAGVLGDGKLVRLAESAELMLFVIFVTIVMAVVTCVSMPLLIRLLSSAGVVDVPNARSSHRTAVPRGAGIALVIALPVAGLAFYIEGYVGLSQLSIVMTAAAIVGGIGYFDDRSGATITARLIVHCFAALLVVMVIFREIDAETSVRMLLLALLWIAALVWGLNLYNFMDGIDGLALQQAIFLAIGGALLLGGTGSTWFPMLVSLAAGCSVLLYWNWSPARVFIGDVGSGFLGFLLAAVAVHSVAVGEVRLAAWIILWGVFFVDTTVTLVKRIYSGERWYQAHRSHAYQHLSRRFRSHAAVTAMIAGINIFWLLPWAWATQVDRVSAGVAVTVALAPLALGAMFVGAGKSELIAER